MVKFRILFKIYYIGNKKYHGSQRQQNVLTIEQCLLNAFKKKKYIKEFENTGFEVASRTDRLVSARGACFTCITEKKPILMELNSVLPENIGIWAYTKVPLDFSSRYNAVLRYYVYMVPTPLSYLQNKTSFNIEILHKACKHLEGQHDFINFSKKEKGEINTVRDMDSVVISVKNDFLIFHFKSKGFLRQQIRRIVKKLLELGKGDINYEAFLYLFDTSKTFSYQPADPRGLVLWDIIFNDKIVLKEDPKSIERMNSYFLKKKYNSGFKHQLFSALQQDNFSY
ncbi:hypothetical protein LCGC14_1206610 [marine sediment metagenome]|uniref:Pseudouridine synthase I TruA alpha/beta domain-containing protein n=1 Tax=marine sediment metagenome TaxID=412755 RepID=A0A0F9LJN6_9ZZZZ